MKKRKKIHGLDIYVIFSITMLILYTVVCIVLTCEFNANFDTLTQCFFGFFGGEIVTCALIKIFKIKENNNF
jgi:hypothetical protein